MPRCRDDCTAAPSREAGDTPVSFARPVRMLQPKDPPSLEASLSRRERRSWAAGDSQRSRVREVAATVLRLCQRVSLFSTLMRGVITAGLATLGEDVTGRTWTQEIPSLVTPFQTKVSNKKRKQSATDRIWEDLRVNLQRKLHWTAEKHSIPVKRWVNADQNCRSSLHHVRSRLDRNRREFHYHRRGEETAHVHPRPQTTQITLLVTSHFPWQNLQHSASTRRRHAAQSHPEPLLTDFLYPGPTLLLLELHPVRICVKFRNRATHESSRIHMVVHAWWPHGHPSTPRRHRLFESRLRAACTKSFTSLFLRGTYAGCSVDINLETSSIKSTLPTFVSEEITSEHQHLLYHGATCCFHPRC